MPVIKNGAKGTSDFKLFFLKIINPIPIIAPKEKAKNRAKIVLGKERKRPIKKTSFTSPKPNHLPLEKRKIAKNKKVIPKERGRVFSRKYLVLSIKG